MSEQHAGGCLCGRVRYVATGRPSRAGICHCRMCQRATGQPLVAGAVFAKAALRITGETRAYRSSPRALRHFCPTCGSPLFFEPLDQPDRSGPRFWDQGLEWSRVLIRHCDGGSDGEDKTEV
ncbi:MAG: GFA family protein [Alphaproteobacteria bacterium]|nr:GFA family protein [Alphaproteobacteria bacterium]